jgi:hypothetical protein
MDVYSESVGIDHNLTHDAAIGRFGGWSGPTAASGWM